MAGATNKRKRKIIAYLATSADGYIARADGSVDWLERPRPKGNYGMSQFLRSIDTILWGRKTYEQNLMQTGGKGSSFGADIKNYVFSHRPDAQGVNGFEFVYGPIRQFAQRLREEPGKDIWMMGGGGIIASFLDLGEIDAFIIHVVPVLIGEGIPLLKPEKRTVDLSLAASRQFADGVVRLHYRVNRSAPVPQLIA
jgi:dihydrofolate reductase